MKQYNFHGYGYQKNWHWGMRSDLPIVASIITPGEIYITPWTMDTPCIFNTQGIKAKWTYQISGIDFGESWIIDWYIGVYKRMRGMTGTAGTMELIGFMAAGWYGIADAGPITIYDTSSSASITAALVAPITDGQLYLAQLWTVSLSGLGITAALTRTGNLVTSGTWCYETSGVTGATVLPQTIAAGGGLAKVVQEHWIGEN